MKIEVLHYIPCVVLGVAVLVANLANTPNRLSNIIMIDRLYRDCDNY
jgi:hypothetical protein